MSLHLQCARCKKLGPPGYDERDAVNAASGAGWTMREYMHRQTHETTIYWFCYACTKALKQQGPGEPGPRRIP